MSAYLEVFQGVNGLWYWRRISAEGHIICNSDKGYTSTDDLIGDVVDDYPEDRVRFIR